jgi:hypothetical protein
MLWARNKTADQFGFEFT